MWSNAYIPLCPIWKKNHHLNTKAAISTSSPLCKRNWAIYHSLPQFFHWDAAFLSNFTELPHLLHSDDCGPGVVESVVAPELLPQSILNASQFQNDPHCTSSNHTCTRRSWPKHHLGCTIVCLGSAIHIKNKNGMWHMKKKTNDNTPGITRLCHVCIHNTSYTTKKKTAVTTKNPNQELVAPHISGRKHMPFALC